MLTPVQAVLSALLTALLVEFLTRRSLFHLATDEPVLSTEIANQVADIPEKLDIETGNEPEDVSKLLDAIFVTHGIGIASIEESDNADIIERANTVHLDSSATTATMESTETTDNAITESASITDIGGITNNADITESASITNNADITYNANIKYNADTTDSADTTESASITDNADNTDSGITDSSKTIGPPSTPTIPPKLLELNESNFASLSTGNWLLLAHFPLHPPSLLYHTHFLTDYPNAVRNPRLSFATLDCDAHPILAAALHVRHYPSLHLITENGRLRDWPFQLQKLDQRASWFLANSQWEHLPVYQLLRPVDGSLRLTAIQIAAFNRVHRLIVTLNAFLPFLTPFLGNGTAQSFRLGSEPPSPHSQSPRFILCGPLPLQQEHFITDYIVHYRQ